MKVIDGNKDIFDKEVIKYKDKVLVDFNATCCGPCRMLGPILDEIAEENTIKVVSIDVDENEELAFKYGVSSIPCLVLFEGGEEKSRTVGFMPKEEVIEFIGE